MGLSQNRVAREIHVSPRRINELVLGKRAMTADTDLRLARYFGVSEGFFLGLQGDYDLMERQRHIEAELVSSRPARRSKAAFPLLSGVPPEPIRF